MSGAKKRNRFVVKTPENGDLNQYWYSPATIGAMVEEAVAEGTRVACLSTPSIFFSLPKEVRAVSAVLDLDDQWANCEQYTKYDFNAPEELPESLHGAYDYLIVDPPFITREVLERYAEAVKLLSAEGAKVMWTSVAENQAVLDEIVPGGMSAVAFKPSIPHLVYQYSLFTNYASTGLDRLNPEIPE